MSTRRTILIVVAAALAALVLADRASVFDGAAANDERASLREVYLRTAALAKKQEALLERRDDWSRAHELAQQRWGTLSERLIVRPSVEIAQGELRERLTRLASDLGLPRPESRPMATETPDEGSPLRVIQLSMDVRTDAWDRAYRLIDRIETDPRMIAAVTRVTLDGPGLAQMEREMTVSLTVRAIAMVGDEAAAEREAS